MWSTLLNPLSILNFSHKSRFSIVKSDRNMSLVKDEMLLLFLKEKWRRTCIQFLVRACSPFSCEVLVLLWCKAAAQIEEKGFHLEYDFVWFPSISFFVWNSVTMISLFLVMKESVQFVKFILPLMKWYFFANRILWLLINHGTVSAICTVMLRAK